MMNENEDTALANMVDSIVNDWNRGSDRLIGQSSDDSMKEIESVLMRYRAKHALDYHSDESASDKYWLVLSLDEELKDITVGLYSTIDKAKIGIADYVMTHSVFAESITLIDIEIDEKEIGV